MAHISKQEVKSRIALHRVKGERTNRKSLILRLPVGLSVFCTLCAEAEGVSVNAWITKVLESAFEAHSKD